MLEQIKLQRFFQQIFKSSKQNNTQFYFPHIFIFYTDIKPNEFISLITDMLQIKIDKKLTQEICNSIRKKMSKIM